MFIKKFNQSFFKGLLFDKSYSFINFYLYKLNTLNILDLGENMPTTSDWMHKNVIYNLEKINYWDIRYQMISITNTM